MANLNLTNLKKINVFEDNLFDKINKNSDRNKIINAIKNRDVNVDIRKEKIKERQFLKPLQTENHNDESSDSNADHMTKSITSMVSKLPIVETPKNKNLFMNVDKNFKNETKLKTLLQVFYDQANNIFQQKIKADENYLISSTNSETNKDSNNDFNCLNIAKPKEINSELLNETRCLNSKNIALQEYRLDTIFKNGNVFCNHSVCNNFLRYYRNVNISTESSYSFLRRYLFFEMEMFESKQKLSEGNIRQECFLNTIYNDFLKKTYKMAGEFDKPMPEWKFLNTHMESQEEVDFDLKYWCMKSESSLNDCSILNDELCCSENEIDYLGNQCMAVNNKENISDVYVELASFAKPMASSQVKRNKVEKNKNKDTIHKKIPISSLNNRAGEFLKTERKLRNKIVAATNKELFTKCHIIPKTEGQVVTDLSFANSTDLPPWFSSNSHKINKNILYKPHIRK
ncbi:uncharacterized protein HGUI_01228 [Hanseniaspora guilliermondii]|uniref:Uncharacterized protein n=1 Tax=Hanseniaspora guilliermondii TaxID=56406 RepID=A0A1L0AZR8_9ASCO|nr:uncharacterized protein HGUI_01228 [Hanseniaspora guilliermondii]